MTHQRIDRLVMRGIVKQFPGVLAADHIDFDVQSGEVHALLGENGAGKSTLMKMLYGLYQPDEGTIEVNDSPVKIGSPQDAIRLGIGMIHQHFMLVPSLTVAENVALGMRGIRDGVLRLDDVVRGLLELSEQYNLKINPHTPIWQLAVGEQQRVEILRALYKGAALLILDEPTAVLTPQEVDDLFRILRQMTDDGHALIFISHKLHEVLAISHRVTVLRDGKKIDTIPTSEATKRKLAEMMVGRPVVLEYDKHPVKRGEVRLRLERVSALSNRGDLGLKHVSLELHSGEIVGVAGVSGNGQHELAQVIVGLRPLESGAIYVDGNDVTGKSPAVMNRLGVSYIPEERMIDGVVKEFTVAENLVLQDHAREPFARGGLFMNFKAITEACQRAIRDYEIKTPNTETPVKNLSGGNIQKLILARELSRNPHVLIAAQPTRGVDIGAMEYIHQRLLDEREKGTAILLISEDLDEIRLLADRIAVLFEGEIVGIVDSADADVETLGLMMAGVREHES
ncbi:MAG: ABC transporter ATP-binding protein [Chloroflexi bacterium]|nr:MAG: heme ABC transporter ATP-binding protein [Phototrophicales bacterium]RMF78634.1 MAG: ABC transporter ATP-binding protein [Chloroflexota bacterium]